MKSIKKFSNHKIELNKIKGGYVQGTGHWNNGGSFVSNDERTMTGGDDTNHTGGSQDGPRRFTVAPGGGGTGTGTSTGSNYSRSN